MYRRYYILKDTIKYYIIVVNNICRYLEKYLNNDKKKSIYIIKNRKKNKYEQGPGD